MKKKKTFKLRQEEDPISEDQWDEAERDYAKNWEPNPVLRGIVKYTIMAMILIGCSFIWYNKKYAPVDTDYSPSEERKKRFLGTKYAKFSKLVEAGDAAFEAEDYFGASYNYKQALSYYATNYPLYEKLLTATKKSCDQGNELHCKNIKGIKKRMEEVARLMNE